MISNSEYWNDIESLDFDDLFSSPFEFISQNDNDQYPNLNDDSIQEKIFLSSEDNRKQLQILSINNSPQESHLLNLSCAVCGAPAYGYNFDQLTCESCKAFFRRNALQNKPNLKCRFGGSCVINVQTRRQCTYCRLKKCFDMKMRKDWIRTEEEKELRQLQKLVKEQRKLNKLTDDQQPLINLPLVARKKKRLMIKSVTEEFFSQPIIRINSFDSNNNLPNDDRILLNNITNAYQSIVDKMGGLRMNKSIQAGSLVEFINDESKTHESLINFYKCIPEFNQLHIEDQMLLIKCNLNNIIHLHYIIVCNFQDNPLIGKQMSKWISKDFHQEMFRTRQYFNRFIEHPLILKLALIVFIFSINLSTPRGSSQFNEYKNHKELFQCQNYYTTILWRYLNYLFEEKEAIRSMEIIITKILHFQTLMITMEDHIRQESYFHPIHELIQSTFGLT